MDLKHTLTPEFCKLVDDIEKSGLGAEIIADALLTMQLHPHASPQTCLKMAAYEWDI